MTITTKQILTYGAIILALGLLVGFYGGCRVGGVKTVLMSGAATQLHDSVSVHDTTTKTEYIPGKSYALPGDTIYTPIPGQFRVDTVRYTNEKTVYVPKVTHDTVVKIVHSGARASFLATLNAEHDFLSGYGAAIELDGNLDGIGLRNYALYVSGGFTRGFTSHGEPRFAAGVKIPLWEGP